MFETLKIECKDGYAVVTLNRPGALNALSSKLIREFASAFAEFETDPDVELVILTGAGRAFCAGLDTKELGSAGVHAFDIEKFNIPDIIERFPGPVVAAINGLAVTGGFEIALACDAILVAESARFIDSHSRIGLLPGWGLSQRLSRAIGPYRAKDLSLSGRALSGSEAAAWGLASRCVPDGELLDAAGKLAREMVAAKPGMLVALKALINEGNRLPLDHALAMENATARAANSARGPDQLGIKKRHRPPGS